jgi:excisionase family DNA binding protein
MHWLTLPCTVPASSRTMVSAPENVMTVKEVADYLRVNQRTVYRLAVERRMPGFKVGATWRFKRADIERWIADQAALPAAGADGEGPAGKTAR